MTARCLLCRWSEKVPDQRSGGQAFTAHWKITHQEEQ